MPVILLEPLPPHVTKALLLTHLHNVGGLDKSKVGRIELAGKHARIEVPPGWEARLVKALDGGKFLEGRLRAVVVDLRPAHGAEEDHFQRLGRLLELESAAAARQSLERARRLTPGEAEKSGLCLLDMVVLSEETGLGGRFLVSLVKRKTGQPLPWNRLSVGTPVLLSEAGELERGCRGIVCQRSEALIAVALDVLPDADDDAVWRIDASSDETAERRQRAALQRAASAKADRLAQLRDVLLGDKAPEFTSKSQPLDFSHSGLNDSQREAVRLALAARDVAMIHGPPGTGKTTAVVELIRQAVRRGEKVLACAPSNTGVDNLLERLVAAGEKAVRLGHPARVTPALREHTLDLLVAEHNDVRLANKLVKDALKLHQKAERHTRAKPKKGARRELRQEAGQLFADARRLEKAAVEDILNRADILCATTTGLDSEILGRRQFDLAAIDEACQSTEPGCWLPILRAERVVLAGDHCQLPPTVVSAEAASQGFAISMFERLMGLMGDVASLRLRTQYRMHEQIAQFSSAEFYDGDLEAHASVAAHRLCDLPGVAENDFTRTVLEFVDTAGAGHEEELEPDGESRLNPGEAVIVRRRVQALIAAGLAASQIAVIAPYSAQVRYLRQQLIDVPGLEVDSVDGFQGREKEAVVISLVRSNATGEIGFLGDVRRMNVALTRARRKLIVIGDSATLASDPFYRRLLDYFESQQAYRTVWEET